MEITNKKFTEVFKEEDKQLKDFKNRDFFNILRSSGKSRSPKDFPILEYCLTDTGSYPRVKNYSAASLNSKSFFEDLESLAATILFSNEEILENNQTKIELIYYRIKKGYFIEVESHFEEATKFDLETRKKLLTLGKENLVLTSYATLYVPYKNSPLYSEDLEESLDNMIKFHQIKKNPKASCIGMVCKEHNFYIKDFYITKEYNLINSDLHYGRGFEEFHANLLERFSNDTKGLVLFHGEPGTGKTYYIRTLIRDLISLGKQVIYFPPSMVSHLISPEIMTFLSSTVIDLAEEGKSCVLLLEDAEPLLVSRSDEGRSDGITNLLNITDGLLNDMLSIQVIATFNTDMKNIDTALLRPERLIARKEFKKLKKEEAQQLLNFLEVDTVCKKEMTLAEIYSERKQKDILVHGYYPDEQRKIGF